MSDHSPTESSKTASPEEIARFSAIADAWWDADGDFKPLHRLNPIRLAFIRDHACVRFGRDPKGEKPLDGLRVLDIGCGGGLLSEPMTRLGAQVVGIDAAEKSINVARVHAERGGLDIDYRCAPPEDFARAAGGGFDIVLNMEVLEHVADLDAFFAVSAEMVKPGGIMVISTLNRTLKSLALAKFGAEYVLRWLPAGTHDWRKFVRPSELADGLGPRGIEITKLAGVVYNPLRDEWLASKDVSVNYMALGVKD
ncbi:MAG: bifunctional 2-polyprenyl-6-hydroxyphenol methylase/3-demethylubiquinol 3-O-methyltransferase UbiG [Alphaproteobacteria bacterium]|nr:bifunctional 2-polyprenyl-6-hydroxyphenol methylase/3-demethylubiquinol 3-O-methyltransferase UbiG [Alphaproteobacteria bacterium]